MVKKHFAVALLFFAALIIPIGCAKKHPEEFKIGALMPLTGDNATYGVALRKGMELAQDEINSSGGVKGLKLKLIIEDDQANPQKGLTGYQKLTSVDKVKIVLGGMFSAVTLAIAPVAERDHVVILSPTSSAVDITKSGDYIFRIYPSDSYDGVFLSSISRQTLKAKTAYILYLQVSSTTSIAEVFADRFQAGGGKVIASEGYPEGTKDFRSQLEKIRIAKPDIIFIPGYTKEMALIVRQAKELGIKSQFVSGFVILRSKDI